MDYLLYALGLIITLFSGLGVSLFFTVWIEKDKNNALKWYNPVHWIFALIGIIVFIFAFIAVVLGGIFKSRKLNMLGTGLDQAVNGLIGGSADNTISGAFGYLIRAKKAYWNERLFNKAITIVDINSDNHGLDSIEDDERNPQR